MPTKAVEPITSGAKVFTKPLPEIFDDIDKAIAAIERIRAEVEAARAEIAKAVDAAFKPLAELTAKNDKALKDTIDANAKALNDLIDKFDEFRADMADALDGLRGDIENLDHSVDDRLDALEERMAANFASDADLRRYVEELHARIDGIATKVPPRK